MKVIDISENWKVDFYGIKSEVNLPFDCLRSFEKESTDIDTSTSRRAVFSKVLPYGLKGTAAVKICGLNGYADVFVNDIFAGALNCYAPALLDVSKFVMHGRNSLRLEIMSDAAMSTDYVGLGVAGGVKLIEHNDNDVEFVYQSLFVSTLNSADKALVETSVELINRSSESKQVLLDISAINQKGRRAGRKTRKFVLRGGAQKLITVTVPVARWFGWSAADPYTYTMQATINCDGKVVDTVSTPFGIVERGFDARGLYINGKNTKLKGAVLTHSNSILGGVCSYSAEMRRIKLLQSAGFNALRFTGCPAPALLKALDDCGMMAVVDIFDVWRTPKSPLDFHRFFDTEHREILINSILELRNHPCVVMYSLCNNIPEAYNRAGGADLAKELTALIKSYDHTRPVTCAIGELVPTVKEIEEAGIKTKITDEKDTAALINLGREKDLFFNRTKDFFKPLDAAGYINLHHRYNTDKLKVDGRMFVGMATEPDKSFDAFDECDKNPSVIGDFTACGIDCFTTGGAINTDGDLDIIGMRKSISYYRQITLGHKHISYIAVVDPESGKRKSLWNWPRYVGKEICIEVYTSGDVVALYLDGKLIGRKLAGRINKNIAVFKTQFYPGKLEAVSLFKGVECTRCSLESVSSPKQIKLSCTNKNITTKAGEFAFVEIAVCDKEGRVVPYAVREIEVSVEGDGELYMLSNADPAVFKNAFEKCPVYEGRALAVIKPKNIGKAVVKAVSEGLTPAKLTVKIKDEA